MVGLRWFKVSADLMRHKKSTALAGRLHDDRAWAYVVQMWAWFCEQAGNGEQTGPDAAFQIARGAGWVGDPDEFVRHVVAVGFLETIPEGFRVHNWAKWAGAHVEYQKRDAERKRVSRGGSEEAPLDTHTTSSGQSMDGPQDCLSTLSSCSSVSEGGTGGTRKPTRSEKRSAKFPAVAAVLRAVRAGGWQAQWPKSPEPVEAAATAVGAEEAARRLLAAVATERAAGREPKPWLGWHLDTIRGGAPPPSRGRQPVGKDFTQQPKW
jgi:hypothetical protein